MSFEGLIKAATRRAFGNNSLIISSTLPSKSPGTRLATPVAFPPGRERLDASPMPIGSATKIITIGISEVASLAARAACGETVTMRSGLDCTRSVASVGSSSRREPASLRSMTTVVPPTHPRLRRPSQKASKLGPLHAGAHSIPTRGNLDAAWILAVDATTTRATRRTGTAAACRFISNTLSAVHVSCGRARCRREICTMATSAQGG